MMGVGGLGEERWDAHVSENAFDCVLAKALKSLR
jgi:hypothetical protein